MRNWLAEGSATGLLRVLLVASIAVPLALFLIIGLISYRDAINGARGEMERISLIAREHAAKVLDAQAQVTDRVVDLLRGYDETDIRLTEQTLHDRLVRIIGDLPALAGVAVFGRTGHLLVASGAFPAPDLDRGQRDYFQALKNGYQGTYVTQLQTGAVRGEQFFGLARRWVGPTGHFGGVIQTGVSPSTFLEFYRALVNATEPTSGEVVTVVRSDGQIILRWPVFSGPPPRINPNNPFFQVIREHPESGTYGNRSVIDAGAPERIFAYQHVAGYPIYVVAGRSRSAVVAAWARAMGYRLLVGVPATLALFLITYTALRRTRQKEAALTRADAEMHRRQIAEAALLQRQRLDAVGQMTGGVAHDFNNLLTVVIGNLHLMEKRPDDVARVRRLAGNALLAAQRGAEVTQKLLAFSRRQVVHPEMVDLNRRLLEFRPLLVQAATETVTLDFDLAPDLGPTRIDPGQFESAVLNLAANARDAMQGGGKVVISTANLMVSPTDEWDLAPGAYVRVAVADNGPGMNAETAAKAFEPFFTTKEIGRGTGLGLSQVYGFAKQSGGDARIVSVVGRGTTIELLLPRAAVGEAVATPLAERTPLQPAGAEKRVLVVEDEAGVRELAIENLQELGYQTLGAADAAAALELLRGGHRIDVLFSDILMPGGMNGVQLAAEAQRLRPGLKVVLASGYAPTEFGQAIPKGVPLLTKPYDVFQLAKQLEAVLQGAVR